MKSLPIALDRLLANPSYERVEGKLLKVSEDGSRAILELKGKKLRTLMGPLADADWAAMVEKAVIAFLKAGEPTRVFEAKLIPRELKARAATPAGAATAARRSTAAKKTESVSSVPVKWKKYAEARMIGEPVKLTNMEKGFELSLEMIHQIIEHIGIAYLPITKSVSYLDFRKFFHFVCEPGFRAFLNGNAPMPPAPKPAPPVVDEDDQEEEEAPSTPKETPEPPVARPAAENNFRSNLSRWKKNSSTGNG
jgi:hypothetical protein